MNSSLLRRTMHRLELGLRLHRDPIAFARWLGVTIGNDCRLIGLQLWTFGSEPYLIKIGSHVTVSHNARFITHDGGVWVFRDEFPEIEVVAPIIVGDNVFIGANAIILPGVKIDDNSIVAAGAIVTRDVASGTIVAGVPARQISTVAEYRERVFAKASHLRSRSTAEKQQARTKGCW